MMVEEAQQPPSHGPGPADHTIARMQVYVPELNHAVDVLAWDSALEILEQMAGTGREVPPAGIRSWTIAFRRLLTRPILVGLVEHALRNPGIEPRVAALMACGGADSVELALRYVTRVPSSREFFTLVVEHIKDAAPVLRGALRSDDPDRVIAAAHLLMTTCSVDVIGPLRALLRRKEPEVRAEAVTALGTCREGAVLETLREAIRDPAPEVRIAAARSWAGRPEHARFMALLGAMRREKNPLVRRAIVEALPRRCYPSTS